MIIMEKMLAAVYRARQKLTP